MEPRLQPLPSGKLKVGAEHFRRVVRRIECTKPLAGDNISIKETSDGMVISSTVTGTGGTALVPGVNVEIITLNVCLNGQPGVILVYGPLDENE